MITSTEYKERVIDYFRQKVSVNNMSEGDYKLLGTVFLKVLLDEFGFATEELDDSEASTGMEKFNKRILTSTEFKELYMVDNDLFQTIFPSGLGK